MASAANIYLWGQDDGSTQLTGENVDLLMLAGLMKEDNTPVVLKEANNQVDLLMNVDWSQWALSKEWIDSTIRGKFWLKTYQLEGFYNAFPVLICHPNNKARSTENIAKLPTSISIDGSGELKGLDPMFAGYKLGFGYNNFRADEHYIFMVLMPNNYNVYQQRFLDMLKGLYKVEDNKTYFQQAKDMIENTVRDSGVDGLTTQGGSAAAKAAAGALIAAGTVTIAGGTIATGGVLMAIGVAGGFAVQKFSNLKKDYVRFIAQAPGEAAEPLDFKMSVSEMNKRQGMRGQELQQHSHEDPGRECWA